MFFPSNYSPGTSKSLPFSLDSFRNLVPRHHRDHEMREDGATMNLAARVDELHSQTRRYTKTVVVLHPFEPSESSGRTLNHNPRDCILQLKVSPAVTNTSPHPLRI